MNIRFTINKTSAALKRVLKWIIKISGIIFLIMFFIAFTDLPFYAYYNLGTYNADKVSNPDLIVVLGGAGMPSPDGLIRTYYTAQSALEFKKADVIIAHPMSSDNKTYQLDLMANELIMRGVDSARIIYEPLGYNTHTQAKNIAVLIGNKKTSMNVLVITSPEHVYRAIKCFEKCGFSNVGGTAALEKPIEEKMLKNKEENKLSENLGVRYNMWNYLKYEIQVIREYCAILYYKINGWI